MDAIKEKPLSEWYKETMMRCSSCDAECRYCGDCNDQSLLKGIEALQEKLAKAQNWLDNQKERCKDFYDTIEEMKATDDWYYLTLLEEALKDAD